MNLLTRLRAAPCSVSVSRGPARLVTHECSRRPASYFGASYSAPVGTLQRMANSGRCRLPIMEGTLLRWKLKFT
jgi:hypothetical protein